MIKPADSTDYVLTGLTVASGLLLILCNVAWLGLLTMIITIALTAVWLPAISRRPLLSIQISLLILGLTPISTDLSWSHFIAMAGLLVLTLAVPYASNKMLYHEQFVGFISNGQRWSARQFVYIGITACLAYAILPYYLISTGSYLNWTVDSGIDPLAALFLGTNGLGIWDELFFVTIVLAVLQRHIHFWVANIAQATLWTAFLYQLGFHSWGALFLFPFALSQGFLYQCCKSVLYILTIHLTLDLILYLALIYAHHPHWLPIFLFSP